jgi:hypothetical protein
MDVSGQHHARGALPPGKNAGTHRIRGWLGHSDDLDVSEKRKSLPPTRIRTLDRPTRSLAATPILSFACEPVYLVIYSLCG